MPPKRENHQLHSGTHKSASAMATPQQETPIGTTLRGRTSLLHSTANNVGMPTSASLAVHHASDQQQHQNNNTKTSHDDSPNELRQQQYQVNARLCRAVKKCPWMYDRHHANYAKKSVLDKSWLKIARDCEESVASCKERWRNIRAAFARSINIYRTHGGPNRVKPYYLHAELGFLIKPMMEGREKNGKYEDAGDGEADSMIQSNANESEDADNDDDDDNGDCEDNADDADIGQHTVNGADLLPNEENDHNTHVAKTNNKEQLQNLESEVANTFTTWEQSNDISCQQRLQQQNVKDSTAATLQDFIVSTAAPLQNIFAHSAIQPSLQQQQRNQQPQQYYSQHQPQLQQHQKCHHSFSTNDDADAKFFEALLPDLRKMTHQQKIIFKRKVYQSLEEVVTDTYVSDATPAATQSDPSPLANIAFAEKIQMMRHIVNMPDEEWMRLNTFFQQQQQPPQESRMPNAVHNVAAMAKKRQLPPAIAIIPHKLYATATPAISTTTATSLPSMVTTMADAVGTSTTNAPWNQIVPISVKEELDDLHTD